MCHHGETCSCVHLFVAGTTTGVVVGTLPGFNMSVCGQIFERDGRETSQACNWKSK